MYSRFQLVDNIYTTWIIESNGYLLFELSNICKDVILSQRCQESVKIEVSLINMYVLINNIIYL